MKLIFFLIESIFFCNVDKEWISELSVVVLPGLKVQNVVNELEGDADVATIIKSCRRQEFAAMDVLMRDRDSYCLAS